MKIKQYRITIMLLFTVSSSIIVGCAPKLTEEQALAESQALSDGIKNRSSGKIELPATKRIGKTNQRLVLLNHRASLRWLRELGFKFHINEQGITRYRRTSKYNSKGYRTRGLVKVDDPQYIYFNNSRVMITGFSYLRDPQAGEETLYIYDQFNHLRVVTYE